MMGWNELGVVGTIYEDEEDQEEQSYDEEDCEEEEEEGDEFESKSPSLTPSITTSPISPPSSTSLLSPPPSLHSRVDEWCKVTGHKTDVVIQLHDRCFHLHKDPLISRSRYLRRRLTESTDITVIPPSTLTAELLSEIFIFCYDSVIHLTPSNLPAARIAADWLEMDVDEGNGNGNGSLMWRTEVYFRQEIAGDAVNAGHVLRACLRMLPDETAALLAVRCVEVVASGGIDGGWMEELTSALGFGGFHAVAEAMRTWFVHDHDLLYRIVDRYLQAHQEKLSEEEKSKLCFTVNCTKLSHDLLLHLVQNPRLPLRFIVQAMLADQLHTRHTILHLSPNTTSSSSSSLVPALHARSNTNGLTLGAILQRSATLRQASHIRASMEATSFRIESLERDLAGLRRKLRWSEEKRAELETVRSSSFRVVVRPEEQKLCKASSRKGFGRKLMDGLKSVFRASSSTTSKDGVVGRETKVVGHTRNNSFA